uniref:Uncharacterized protein n=1 Tax=viral metagenome TaxID=1070528 RepID=A0A6C0J6W2_9ZZZZ
MNLFHEIITLRKLVDKQLSYETQSLIQFKNEIKFSIGKIPLELNERIKLSQKNLNYFYTNVEIEDLDIPKNVEIEDLDIPKNVEIEDLDIPKNVEIEDLDIPKNVEIEDLDIPKNVEIDLDIPKNKPFNYYYSICNDIQDIAFLLLFTKNLDIDSYTYILNNKEFDTMIKWFEQIYSIIISKITNKYYINNLDNEKQSIFNNLSQILNINDLFKNDSKYIYEKFLKYLKQFEDPMFLKKINIIEDKNNDLLKQTDYIQNKKNHLLDLYNSKKLIQDNIDKKEKEKEIGKKNKKKYNVIKKFNKFLTADSHNISKTILEEKKQKLISLHNNITNLELSINKKELNELYKERDILKTKIKVLDKKEKYKQKLDEIIQTIETIEEDLEFEDMLSKNKMVLLQEEFVLLQEEIVLLQEEIKILDVGQNNILQEFELNFKETNHQSIIDLEIQKCNQLNLEIKNTKEIISIEKHNNYKNNLKLKNDKVKFLKKNVDKVIDYNNKDAIKDLIDKYLNILKMEEINRTKFIDEINNLDFNKLYKIIDTIGIPKQNFKLIDTYFSKTYLKELQDIILWKANIEIQKKLKIKINKISDKDANNSLFYYIRENINGMDKINLIRKLDSIKIKDKHKIKILFSRLKCANLNKNKLELMLISLNEIEIELKILNKFTYD